MNDFQNKSSVLVNHETLKARLAEQDLVRAQMTNDIPRHSGAVLNSETNTRTVLQRISWTTLFWLGTGIVGALFTYKSLRSQAFRFSDLPAAVQQMIKPAQVVPAPPHPPAVSERSPGKEAGASSKKSSTKPAKSAETTAARSGVSPQSTTVPQREEPNPKPDSPDASTDSKTTIDLDSLRKYSKGI